MTEIIKSRTTSAPRNTNINRGYNSQHHLPGPNYSNSYSGRIITNLLPSQQGLQLPIVGERVLKTTEELESEARQATAPTTDLNLQTKQLQELVGKVKDSKEYKKIMANYNVPHIPAHTNVLEPSNGANTSVNQNNTSTVNQTPTETALPPHTEPPKVIENNGNTSLYIEDNVKTQTESNTPSEQTSQTNVVQAETIPSTQQPIQTSIVNATETSNENSNPNQTPINQVQPSNLKMQSTAELAPNTGFHEPDKINLEPSLAVAKPVTPEKPKGFFAKLFKRKEVERTVSLSEGIHEEVYKPNEAKVVTNETKVDKPKVAEDLEKDAKKEAALPKGVKPLSMVQNFITGGTKYSNMAPITQTPNCISGIVYDPKGIALERKVVLIKNDDGETVRAVKTNNLGQFIITSPLTNGVYTISIPNAGDNFSFTQMQIKLEGKVAKPLEFNGS